MRDDSADTARLTGMFLARDERAVREAEQIYGPLCMSIALNLLGNRQDAEECVNDTWLRAWNHIPPDRPRSLAAYLGTIVRNLAINRWRTGRNRAFLLDLDALRESLPLTEEEADELPALLNEFLAEQQELDRKLFVGRYWYARPVKDMARAYGLSPNTAAQRIARTRKRLQIFLEERGYTV